MDIVGDIMTKRVGNTESYGETRISRVVVTDMEKKPVGIITLTDVTMISSLLKPAKLMKEKKPVFLKGILLPPKGYTSTYSKGLHDSRPHISKRRRRPCRRS